jgi:hypothetical protein
VALAYEQDLIQSVDTAFAAAKSAEDLLYTRGPERKPGDTCVEMYLGVQRRFRAAIAQAQERYDAEDYEGAVAEIDLAIQTLCMSVYEKLAPHTRMLISDQYNYEAFSEEVERAWSLFEEAELLVAKDMPSTWRQGVVVLRKAYRLIKMVNSWRERPPSNRELKRMRNRDRYGTHHRAPQRAHISVAA